MDLLLLRLSDAVAYEPSNRTYAIRIFHPKETFKVALQNSPNYIDIKEYSFSDTWPGGVFFDGDVLFNEDHARKIITDFDKKRNICDTLLVHCSRGINRSPAVGIALNDLFNLGHDSEALKKKFEKTNWYVYEKLLEVGKTYLG